MFFSLGTTLRCASWRCREERWRSGIVMSIDFVITSFNRAWFLSTALLAHMSAPFFYIIESLLCSVLTKKGSRHRFEGNHILCELASHSSLLFLIYRLRQNDLCVGSEVISHLSDATS